MKIDLKELISRAEFIRGTPHETEGLTIWNYTAKCQFERAWDEYTRMARGLITDSVGNIIARPFPKFFNYGETEETKTENLPKDIPIVTVKLDGSLGIQYYLGNKLYIATRGSFTSEQAIWATKWMQERFTQNNFVSGYTYLYEIIYPENKIVVDYGNTVVGQFTNRNT